MDEKQREKELEPILGGAVGCGKSEFFHSYEEQRLATLDQLSEKACREYHRAKRQGLSDSAALACAQAMERKLQFKRRGR